MSRKVPLGNPTCTWEYNIKMDYREIGYEDMNWIELVQIRM